MADIQLLASPTFLALKNKTEALIKSDGRLTLIAPVGDGYANPKKGLIITGAGAGSDVALSLEPTNGSMSALDIRGSGTGYNARFFNNGGLLETYISDGNALITAKWIGIYASIYTDNLAGVGSMSHPAYSRVYHPPTLIPHMFGVGADVNLAVVLRGNNSADNKVQLIMDLAGYGTRLDMSNGAIHWPRADEKPYIGDVLSTNPPAATTLSSTSFPIVLETFNAAGAYGLRLRSTAVGTIGAANLFVGNNGGLYGDTGRSLIRNESSALVRVGNSIDQTIINSISQTVFEINGGNVAYLVDGGFHPLVDNTKDLGTSGLRWNDLYVGNAPTVGSDERIKDDIALISDAILDAWAEVEPKMFRYKQSKEEKGDKARTHFGYIAQDILKAFKKHKLDAGDYGIVVFQKWDDKYEDEIDDVVIPEETVMDTVVWESRELIDPRTNKHISTEIQKARVIPEHTVRMKTGNKVKVLDAGELWSVRYEQCSVLNRALAMRDAKRTKSK